jgi:hypothetical protein
MYQPIHIKTYSDREIWLIHLDFNMKEAKELHGDEWW